MWRKAFTGSKRSIITLMRGIGCHVGTCQWAAQLDVTFDLESEAYISSLCVFWVCTFLLPDRKKMRESVYSLPAEICYMSVSKIHSGEILIDWLIDCCFRLFPGRHVKFPRDVLMIKRMEKGRESPLGPTHVLGKSFVYSLCGNWHAACLSRQGFVSVVEMSLISYGNG